MSKLLGVFAHPDDETFFAGGTIAKYAKSDWPVDLICATRGEAGELGPYASQEEVKLGNIRQKELEQAAGLLGCHSVTFMDYKDGTLASQSPGNIEDKLMQLFIEFKPDAVMTFEPGGITNHPDHVKLSLAATFAFQTYAKLRDQENPSDPQPPKFYYACMPESVAEYLKKNKVIPAESYGKPWRGIPDKNISNVIDIKRLAAVKKKALLAHVSQSADTDQFLSFPTNPMLRHEYFMLRMIGTKEAFMGKNDIVSDRL